MEMPTPFKQFILFMSRSLLYIIICLVSFILGCRGKEGSNSNLGAAITTNNITALSEPNLPSVGFRFNSIVSYLEWYMSSSSGNKVVQEQNGCVYEMTYKPELIKALDALNPGMKVDNEFIDRANNQALLSDNVLFRLKISGSLELKNFRTEKSFQEYFGYEAEKDFKLIVNHDTLNPVMLHYENTYPQLPYLSILLSFKRMRNPTNFQQVIFNGTLGEPITWSFNKNTLFYQPAFTKINELWR